MTEQELIQKVWDAHAKEDSIHSGFGRSTLAKFEHQTHWFQDYFRRLVLTSIRVYLENDVPRGTIESIVREDT